MHNLVTVDSSDRHCIATWHNVLIAVMRDTPDPERLGAVRRALTELARRHSSVAMVVVLEPSGGTPDGATRRAAAALMRSTGQQIAGWAVVLEGGGIIRPTIRSVAVAIKLVARVTFPLQICGTVQAAADWFAGLPDPARIAGGRAAELPQAVASARARIASAA